MKRSWFPTQALTLLATYALMSPFAHAAESISDRDTQTEIVEPILNADRFRPWILTGHYSFLDLLIPSKLGLAVELRNDSRRSWVLEYSHGSFVPFFVEELGSFSETRWSLTRRHSGEDGAGFQFFYGGFYQTFQLSIGDALLSRLSSGTVPHADMVSISSFGSVVGVGYRWLIEEKFVIAIDGIAWSQPLITTSKENEFLRFATNQKDREDIENLARVVEYFPRFATAKLTLGYAF